MKLWTVQPIEVVDILNKEGVFTCDVNKCENYEHYKEAYRWMVGEMNARNIPHPQGVESPLWAWHTTNWEHKKPDFRRKGFGVKGRRYACIEIEISDCDVLVSDFDNWHFVLNRLWINDCKNEKEWEKLNAWYEKLDSEDKYKMMVESWQKIFDITSKKDEWNTNGCYIQAVFWELRKEMVKSVRYFVAR